MGVVDRWANTGPLLGYLVGHSFSSASCFGVAWAGLRSHLPVSVACSRGLLGVAIGSLVWVIVLVLYCGFIPGI